MHFSENKHSTNQRGKKSIHCTHYLYFGINSFLKHLLNIKPMFRKQLYEKHLEYRSENAPESVFLSRNSVHIWMQSWFNAQLQSGSPSAPDAQLSISHTKKTPIKQYQILEKSSPLTLGNQVALNKRSLTTSKQHHLQQQLPKLVAQEE